MRAVVTFSIREVCYYSGAVEVDVGLWGREHPGRALSEAGDGELEAFIRRQGLNVMECYGEVEQQEWSDFVVTELFEEPEVRRAG